MKALPPESFRPRFGIGLTVAIGLIAVAVAVVTLVDEGFTAVVSSWPWIALMAGGCWAVFYNPRVDVDAGGVRLVNVWHTVHVPWQALIGLETKWALTLVTGESQYRAWAAPAPGRTVMRSEHPNTHRLSEAAIGGEIRPGDLPNTDSGEAAALVRKHWRVYLHTLDVESDDREVDETEVVPLGPAPVADRSFHVAHAVVALVLVAMLAVAPG